MPPNENGAAIATPFPYHAFGDDYIMPPMPPMSGIAGAPPSFAGLSATIASVVISRPATDAAS
ncbi:MAG: hypothetical protein RLZ60_918, partial [Pseudomonadota bacterium]